jgi:hypothetical protein
MPLVKVARQGVSAEEAAAVLRARLGSDVRVSPDGSAEVNVRKGFFSRAKVEISAQTDGTLFDVKGSAQAGPIVMFTLRYINNRGIGREVAAALQAGLGDRG